jgi:hypothetical protein
MERLAETARRKRRVPRVAPLSVDCNGLLAEREELTDEQWAIIAPLIPEPLLTAFTRPTSKGAPIISDQDVYLDLVSLDV